MCKKCKVRFSILLLFFLIFNSFAAFATEPEFEMMFSKEEIEVQAENKIASEVLDELNENGKADIIIYLNSQVDVESVSNTAKNTLASNITPHRQKLLVRRSIVNVLQENSEKTQQNILAYLKKEKARGNVEDFESYFIVNAIHVKANEEVIRKVASMSEVKKIYENKIIPLNVPEISKNTIEADENGIEWNIDKVGAPQVWNEFELKGEGIVVGVIDSGVDWTHEALKEKWRGYNPNDPDNPIANGNWFDAVEGKELPYDIVELPHGSHVIGTILGQDPEGKNKIGVAPNAQWIAAKAFTKDGGQDAWLLSAGQWMLAPGGNSDAAPDIINNSWGGGPGLDEWYRDMVKAWREAGIVPVFAAGNEPGSTPAEPGSIETPGNYPESFAVAAVDIKNIRGSFSRLGPSPYGDSIKPDISAPGVSIRSSVPGGYEDGWNGTSMAAPAVSGVAALILQADSSLTVEEVENIMKSTATTLTDDDYPDSPNYAYGHGIVNAYNAVAAIRTGIGTVKGKVLVGGEDKEKPQIIHEQSIKLTYNESDYFVEAQLIDDVSIVNANLLARKKGTEEWTTIRLLRQSGNYKNGIYKAQVPYDIVMDPGFEYKIIVTDYAGNVEESEIYEVEVKFGIEPGLYSMDFETFPTGWALFGEWEWGEPGKMSPTPYSGTKLVGTVLNGYYSSMSKSLLGTPPIDLRDKNIKDASLRLHHWYSMDRDDVCKVYVTKDYGKTWIPTGQVFSKTSNGWEELTVDLKEYIGEEGPIYVGFRLESEIFASGIGWYIDDIEFVTNDITPPAANNTLTFENLPVGVRLTWEKGSESDIKGYNIYRKETVDSEYTLLSQSKNTEYLDTTVESGKIYEYVITSVDVAENESEYSNKVEVDRGSIQFVYFADFDKSDCGYVSGGGNNSWEWGIPESGPNGAFTGSRLWATNLKGEYSRNSDAWLQSTEITVPTEGNPYLTFAHWYETERYPFDYCYVTITEDNGETWKDVTPEPGYFHLESGKWIVTNISLDEYKGKNIKVRFNFKSDTYVCYAGWYIDHVAVVTGVSKEDVVNDVPEVNEDDSYFDMTEEMKIQLDAYQRKESELNISLRDRQQLIETGEEEITGIPVESVVTILETGRSVRVSPVTGEYNLIHAIPEEGKEWTLLAEAYGYYPKEEKVSILKDEVVIKNFKLEPIPQGVLRGKVIDRYTKEPIANATLRLKEDPNIPSVKTDENGNFIFPQVYEGDYTILVSAANFYRDEVEISVVGNDEVNVEVNLKAFVGIRDEIAYDDGEEDNAVILNSIGSGLAVRFTPESPGMVTGVNILFKDESYPTPGGDEIGVAIFDTDGLGNPTVMIGEPLVVDVVRGEWNYIDLSSFGFTTDKDFFITTTQTKIGEESPAICVDTTIKQGRTYLYVNKAFKLLKDDDALNAMIRAVFEKAVDIPRVTNLDKVNYTTKNTINVEGTVLLDSMINIYLNGERVKEVQTNKKMFNEEIELVDGENIIELTAIANDKETEKSAPIKVVVDNNKPVINVVEPLEDFVTNREVVTVSGNIVESYLDRFTVNGYETQVEEDGSFEIMIPLVEGENTINIEAVDLAGNQTIITRNVMMTTDGPALEDIMPAEDMVVNAGDLVEISFRGEAGGEAFFSIIQPLQVSSNEDVAELEMTEEEPGLYKATWVVPENTMINRAMVKIVFRNSIGNITSAIAPGRITVGQSLSDTLPMEELPYDTVIVGNEAYDIKYLNSNAEAQTKLINWYNQGNQIYIKLSDTTLVNINGELVDMDILPDEITYYDAFGNTLVYNK